MRKIEYTNLSEFFFAIKFLTVPILKKNKKYPHLNFVFSDGNWCRCTDGYRVHSVSGLEIPKGNYEVIKRGKSSFQLKKTTQGKDPLFNTIIDKIRWQTLKFNYQFQKNETDISLMLCKIAQRNAIFNYRYFDEAFNKISESVWDKLDWRYYLTRDKKMFKSIGIFNSKVSIHFQVMGIVDIDEKKNE